MARVLRASDAEVLVDEPYVDHTTVDAVGATAVTRDELLPRADILSRPARPTPETSHLAGASRKAAEREAIMAAAEAGRCLRGEPLRFVSNPEAIAHDGG